MKQNKLIIIIITILGAIIIAFLLIYIKEILFYFIFGHSKWNSSNITYSIDKESCGSAQTSRIIKAFQQIQKDTGNTMIFKELNNSANIKISCSEQIPQQQGFNKIISDKGETSTLMIANRIISAEIIFYNINPLDKENPECKNDLSVEIHEILHALGFSHSNKPNSIMYPQNYRINNSCQKEKTKIDNKIINKIKEIYGN